jgi:glycosyltransferase involved in cell wall biosynthesis
MASTDCGIFPSRAEGWNLELLEMMSCGKHVIATDYSAHTEFCTQENSLLVTIEEKETAYDGKWFTGNCGEWAKLGDNQVEQMVVHMRDIHKRKQSDSLGINKGGVATAKKFSWSNSAAKAIEAIHEYL